MTTTDRETPPPHGGDVFGIARGLGVAPSALLDFSANINPLGFPAGIRQAVAESLDLILHYPDPDCHALKADLADYLGVDMKRLLIGNGSTELMYLLARALKPRRALIIAPAFSEYARALELAGVTTDYHITAEDDGYALRRPLTRDEIAAAAGPDCDVVFLANPASPSGALLPATQMRPIIEGFSRSGLIPILDEAFIDFDEGCSLKAAVGELPNLILLRSFTKFFGIPGIRLGYLIAAEPIIARLEPFREPWSVNTLAQEIGRACLQDRVYIDRTRLTTAVERDFLTMNLAKIDGLEVFPSGVNYLLVKLTRPGWTAARLRLAMLRQGVLIRDASNFRGLDQRFVRLAVRPREENERLLAALRMTLEKA